MFKDKSINDGLFLDEAFRKLFEQRIAKEVLGKRVRSGGRAISLRPPVGVEMKCQSLWQMELEWTDEPAHFAGLLEFVGFDFFYDLLLQAILLWVFGNKPFHTSFDGRDMTVYVADVVKVQFGEPIEQWQAELVDDDECPCGTIRLKSFFLSHEDLETIREYVSALRRPSLEKNDQARQ